MTAARLCTVVVGGSGEPWLAAGFAADAEGRIAFGNGALEFTGTGAGLMGLRVAGVEPADVEGIPVVAGEPLAAGEHPNGAYELDHVVIMTDDLERTSDSVAEVLGLERRRIRETPDVRQAFHRFADRGCIVELVERPGLDGVALWGLVVNVADLHETAAALGPDLVGMPKPAVQPGRLIATFRRGAGLGVPTALMSPDR